MSETESTVWPVQPALVARIEAAIRTFRAADPFLPIHVIVSNHVLGTLLGRSLFADTGYLAIEVQLPHEFAWSVTARESLHAGLLPVPEDVDLAIVLKAAATAVSDKSTPDYLRRAAPMPGFASAALRTLRDIAGADVTPATLDAFAGNAQDGAKVRVLTRIANGHKATLASAKLLDRETLYRRAAALLPTADGRGVVLVGDPPESCGLEVLVARLAATHPFAWLPLSEPPGIAPRRDTARTSFAAHLKTRLEPVEHEHRKNNALARVQSVLFAEGAPSRPAKFDDSVRFLSSPGESLEAVEIARLVLDEAARGVRFQEMAVLLHEPGAYTAHLASAFDRAGIPAFFVDGFPRIDPAARALGLLLDLTEADLDRAQVAEFLTTARIPYRAFLGEDARISPARWDRLSARAGIVSGLVHGERVWPRLGTVAAVTPEYLDGQAHILQGKDIPSNVTILRIHGPFLFGTTDKLADATRDLARFGDIVILRLRNMTALDATGIHALEQFSERLRKTGKRLLLCGARDQPSLLISRSGFLDHVGPENVLPHVQAALARAVEEFKEILKESARSWRVKWNGGRSSDFSFTVQTQDNQNLSVRYHWAR